MQTVTCVYKQNLRDILKDVFDTDKCSFIDSLIFCFFQTYLKFCIFICLSQYDYNTLPSKPCGHSQTNSFFDLGISVQVPLFWQGFITHASYSRSQLSPTKSLVQLQVYPLTRSMQVPPFWHGCDTHSSTLIWQCFPVKTSPSFKYTILSVVNTNIIVIKKNFFIYGE